MKSQGSILGGALLVAGTAIGGGMIALPVLTGQGGFWPAVVLFFVSWLFMACTALLLVEAFLWNREETNLVSMAKMCLGWPGKIAAWLLYLFLFYSLTLAYISGGGLLISDLFETITGGYGPLIFTLVFAPFVYIGAVAVDRLNSLLMGGLLLSFLTFVVLGIAKVDLHLLGRTEWRSAFLATPIVFTSYAFQGIVPTLTNYMGRDASRASRAILVGSAFPLVMYILWQALILGVVPLDDLLAAGSAFTPLKTVLGLPWLYVVGEFLAFFALVTSFLGVTLGLRDFLSDGLKIKKGPSGRFWLCLLTFGPPLVFAMFNPLIFLTALNYAGGIGCALLLGLLPILMVWRGRYILGHRSNIVLRGGRITLTLLLLFILFELVAMLGSFLVK